MDIAFFLETIPGFTFKKFPADVRIEKGDLAKDKDLETAILLSLFTNRRANPSDNVRGDNLGGFWGDKYINALNDQQSLPSLGSRLWLLRDKKVTQESLNFARIYTNEALQWLIDDGVVGKFNVNATALNHDGIKLDIVGVKPNGDQFNFTYGYVWNEIAGNNNAF